MTKLGHRTVKIRQCTRNTSFTVTFFQAETCTPLNLIKKGAELLFLNRVQWLFCHVKGQSCFWDGSD